MPKPIPAVAVKLTRLDGRRDECAKPYESSNVPEESPYPLAASVLQKWARSAPMLGSAYHDVAYAVTFEDGEVYEGTLHLDHDMVGTPPDLGQAIREFCEAAVGQRKPPRMSQAAYDAQVQKVPIARRMYYRAILDYYDLNRKFEVPVFNMPNGNGGASA